MSRAEDSKAGKETLAIPQALRAEVDERDQGHCRVCGKWLGPERALHHIRFGGTDTGMGGRRSHSIDNLVTVCWMWGGNCHDLVHSEKTLYQPVLLDLARGLYPGRTAIQVMRWQAKSSGGRPFTLDEVRRRFLLELVAQPNGCVEWTGHRDANGYGRLNYKALGPRPVLAHRAAWLFHHGTWPAQHLLHECDNPPCCLIEHLHEGTQAQNMLERKARNPRWGAANPASRHALLVPVIRARYEAGDSQADIARALMINSGVVSRIVRGINYPVASPSGDADSHVQDDAPP